MRWIRATLDRRRLRKQIQAGAPDWSLAHRVWGYAHQVNRGLIGPGARSTVELEAVEALAAMAPDAEARFESLLHDPNPCVCGYALLGLYRLQSSLLLQLPLGAVRSSSRQLRSQCHVRAQLRGAAPPRPLRRDLRRTPRLSVCVGERALAAAEPYASKRR